MFDAKINGLEITVDEGAYPVWIRLKNGEERMTITHHQLRSLEFMIKMARIKAKKSLPSQYKDEA